MTTGKTSALTRQTFVGKVTSLLLNMLSRLVITFLLRSKRPFNFVAAITICSDFGAQKNKVWHCFQCFPSASYEVMGPDAMILVFRMLNFKPSFSLSTLHFQGDFGGLVLVCIGTACCPCLAGHCRQKYPIWPQEKHFLFVESFPLGFFFFF